MSQIRNLVAPIIAESGEINFEGHMIPLTNSGEIYEPYFSSILDAALQSPHDQQDAYEIVAPIATEILGFSKEQHPEIYRQLLKAIKKAHDQLMACRERKVIVIDAKVDNPTGADDKLASVIQHTETGWLLEEFDNHLDSEGYLRAVLLRTVTMPAEGVE
ncbi:hypothetical protein ACK8P5_16590 [Paenibacillus sp. EC2-1]|uniref:hypothetical protein n=1 Tax=Paenibacillus sp. EC2-1 TaxID=3388665 RepID=UPI003BEF2C82